MICFIFIEFPQFLNGRCHCEQYSYGQQFLKQKLTTKFFSLDVLKIELTVDEDECCVGFFKIQFCNVYSKKYFVCRRPHKLLFSDLKFVQTCLQTSYQNVRRENFCLQFPFQELSPVRILPIMTFTIQKLGKLKYKANSYGASLLKNFKKL